MALENAALGHQLAVCQRTHKRVQFQTDDRLIWIARRKFKTSVWGAVIKVLLTQRGLLNRESESFGGVFYGPVVNPAFTIGPQMLSLETENAGREAREARMPLKTAGYENTPGTLSLGVLR